MNKKASMQLGINAIVILIIALAILGLAMSFITSLFRGGQSKLGGLIERTDLPVHADATNPLVFDSSDIKVKPGKTAKLIVSVYNSDFGEEDKVGLELMSCVDSAGKELCVPGSTSTSCTPPYDMTLAAPSQIIPRGTDGGYKAIIRVAGGFPRGTYICAVGAGVIDPNTGVLDTSTVVSQQLFVNVII